MTGKQKLLIVEDEAITAMLLKLNLEEAGYNVYKPLAAGEGAVEAIRIQDQACCPVRFDHDF